METSEERNWWIKILTGSIQAWDKKEHTRDTLVSGSTLGAEFMRDACSKAAKKGN
jgi:hypothetical protein